jgi:hypothetical protein
MIEKLPSESQQLLAGLAGLLPTALLARLLLHNKMVKAGHRRFWSKELFWEGPTAVFCAIVGGGVAASLNFEGMATHAVVGAIGWLGPRGMEVMLARYVDRKFPSKTSKDTEVKPDA